MKERNCIALFQEKEWLIPFDFLLFILLFIFFILNSLYQSLSQVNKSINMYYPSATVITASSSLLFIIYTGISLIKFNFAQMTDDVKRFLTVLTDGLSGISHILLSNGLRYE